MSENCDVQHSEDQADVFKYLIHIIPKKTRSIIKNSYRLIFLLNDESMSSFSSTGDIMWILTQRFAVNQLNTVKQPITSLWLEQQL